jgi:hypothetical protein
VCAQVFRWLIIQINTLTDKEVIREGNIESALTLAVVALSIYWSYVDWQSNRSAVTPAAAPGEGGGEGSGTAAFTDLEQRLAGAEQRLAAMEARLQSAERELQALRSTGGGEAQSRKREQELAEKQR